MNVVPAPGYTTYLFARILLKLGRCTYHESWPPHVPGMQHTLVGTADVLRSDRPFSARVMGEPDRGAWHHGKHSQYRIQFRPPLA